MSYMFPHDRLCGNVLHGCYSALSLHTCEFICMCVLKADPCSQLGSARCSWNGETQRQWRLRPWPVSPAGPSWPAWRPTPPAHARNAGCPPSHTPSDLEAAYLSPLAPVPSPYQTPLRCAHTHTRKAFVHTLSQCQHLRPSASQM